MANHRLPLDIAELPKTRAEALLSGSAYYFTGEPCSHGHIEPRSTAYYRCRECNTIRVVRSNQRHEAKARLQAERRRYAQSGRGRATAKRSSTKRRAYERHALPAWAEIQQINEFVSACPEGSHIDHILPLKGSNVCGLHVVANLQYLPAQENLFKSNKIDPLTLDCAVCVLPQYRNYVT